MYLLSIGGFFTKIAPFLIEKHQALLGFVGVIGSLTTLDQLSTGVVQRIDADLMGLDVVDQHLPFSQLNFNDARISENGLQLIQIVVSALDRDQQFIESVLELTQTQQSMFQLSLSIYKSA